MSKKEPPAPTHDDLPEDFEVKIILPARFIPSGSRVTKATGQREYILNRRISVFGLEEKPMTIDGLFLMDGSSYVNAVKEDTKLCLVVEAGDIRQHPLFEDEELDQ